jgi:uncharacterized protein DUF6893
MGRLFRFALVIGAGVLLVHQYPEIRRYFKMSRM